MLNHININSSPISFIDGHIVSQEVSFLPERTKKVFINNVYNRKMSQTTYMKKNITNEDNNIKRGQSLSVTLFLFMTDIFFSYMSDEGRFIFIIHHFV